MALPNRPNSHLVMEEWVRTIPDLADNGINVASTLPKDNSTWGTTGFVVVNVLNGNHDHYLPVGRPVFQVEAFALKPNTGRPLWNTINNILSAIEEAALDESTVRRTLTIAPGGADYGQARVMSIYPLMDDRRLYHPLVSNPTLNRTKEDPAQYGRMVADYEAHWKVVA